MRIKALLIFALAIAGTTVALAQSGTPEGLPWPKGVYVRAGSEWVGIPVNPLLPMMQGTARWLLGFGNGDAVAEMPGPHALVQIGNAKPMFYLRGLPQSNGIYLVRAEMKDDYRKLRMPVSGDFRQFVKLRSQDIVEMDVRQVSADVLSVSPKSDLKAGEYSILSVFEQNYRPIRASFEFGVTSR